MQHEDHYIIEIIESLNPVLSWLKPQRESLQRLLDLIDMPEGIIFELPEDIVMMKYVPKQPHEFLWEVIS